MLSLSIQSCIVAAMALVLHPIVLITVMFRNFAMALTHAPMLNAIAPHIASEQRATYLSIQSLAGRLGFSVLLYSLSRLTQSAQSNANSMDWSQLSFLLRVSLVLSLFALFLMFFTSRSLRFDDDTTLK